jgi:serine-type D-Ala-D-Ala carboxypeptidase/endopeptidase (penicillin-binding protein 4)
VRGIVADAVTTLPARNRRVFISLVATLWVAAAPALGVRQATPPAPLAAALDTWTSDNPATGVVVWRLDPGEPVEVLAFDPTTPRRPASTMKVITATSALLALSPNFQFETRLYAGAAATQSDGVLTGPLYLKGYGDPTLASPAYSRKYLKGVGGPIGKLAQPLRDAGVTAVNGPIVVDETFFDNQRRVATWPARYGSECQPLSAAPANQGYLGDLRGKYVKNPPLATGVRLRLAMTSNGIRQTGRIVAGRAPSEGRLLATVKSPPLSAIVSLMLPDSDNFLAEMLTKNVGAYMRSNGSTTAGTAHAKTLLVGKGLLGSADVLEDGSGLGVSNRLSPTSLVRVLSAADAEPTWGAALIGGLPTGGTGTLKRRFRDPDLRDRVHAKTGYISRTSALAGVVDSSGGSRYAFAIMMNEGPLSGAKATQDKIVTLLASGIADEI